MGPNHTVWAVLCLTLALVTARPSPEAESDAGYRSQPEVDDDGTSSSESRDGHNSILAEEREAESLFQPYGALKLAVTEEPWGALKVAVALAEQERQASERLHTERESVEVSATPEPDAEIVESISSDSTADVVAQPPFDPAMRGGPTMLVLRPYAKAVAGAGGTAIAMPESQAVTRRAGDVVVFEPRAIAVAGPGGRAVASSRLIIDTVTN